MCHDRARTLGADIEKNRVRSGLALLASLPLGDEMVSHEDTNFQSLWETLPSCFRLFQTDPFLYLCVKTRSSMMRVDRKRAPPREVLKADPLRTSDPALNNQLHPSNTHFSCSTSLPFSSVKSNFAYRMAVNSPTKPRNGNVIV
jgi:hypothetical protein